MKYINISEGNYCLLFWLIFVNYKFDELEIKFVFVSNAVICKMVHNKSVVE